MKSINTDFILNNKPVFTYRKCVFVVGAGISVASGIPDFRSPTGIFATLRRELKINGRALFTYNFGLKEGSREIYLKYICALKGLCDGAEPSRTHQFLARHPRSRVYTQNIDGLEERAGLAFTRQKSTRGVYLHGNLAWLICQYCGYRACFGQEEVAALGRGTEMPCTECTRRSASAVGTGKRSRPIGQMHPGIIHYQQAHPDEAFIGRLCEADLDCDMLVVIGTSLAVDGVRRLVKTFCRNQKSEGKRFLVNLTRPNKEWEGYFDYFYEGDCQDFVEAVEAVTGVHKSSSKEGVNASSKVDSKEENDSKDSHQEPECAIKATLKDSLDALAKSFSDEETINKPVLEQALASAASTEVSASFCTDLQEEIERIVSNSVHE